MRGYFSLTKITDFGPYVTKLILPVDETVKTKGLKKDMFSVYVERFGLDGRLLYEPKSFMNPEEKIPARGFIPVKGIYASGRDGEKQKEGAFITLELAYGPLYRNSSMIAHIKGGLSTFSHNAFRITQLAPLAGNSGEINGLVYDTQLANDMPDLYGFVDTVSSYRPMPLRYGYFIPQKEGGQKPLILWLHGAGEGGEQTAVSYGGNKVVALAKEGIQKYFGGAYILSPQCPTYWLDDGSGNMTIDEKSIYTEALKALVDEFLEKNPGADPNRIYIGGDSNGGFMTMRMLMSYPGFFAAAFPICEAMADECITEEDIANLKEIPIWFIHAANDPVVPIDKFVLPTYKRLMAAGAKNVHLTMWDKIVDMHEGFTNEKGEPFEYLGHFAWIPVLNDDCELDYNKKPVKIKRKNVGLFEWMAAQAR